MTHAFTFKQKQEASQIAEVLSSIHWEMRCPQRSYSMMKSCHLAIAHLKLISHHHVIFIIIFNVNVQNRVKSPKSERTYRLSSKKERKQNQSTIF